MPRPASGYTESDEIEVEYSAEYWLQAHVRGELDPDDSHGGWRLKVGCYGSQGFIEQEEVAAGAAGGLGATWQLVS